MQSEIIIRKTTPMKQGKEKARTPRFILVHSSSRATSNLFAPQAKKFTIEHTIQPRIIQYTCSLQEPVAPCNKIHL